MSSKSPKHCSNLIGYASGSDQFQKYVQKSRRSLKYAQLGLYTLLFAEDDYEMFKDLNRTCINIVLPCTPFVWRCFHCRALPSRFAYPGCQRFFLHGFRCRSCSPLTITPAAAEAKQSEVFPYLRPPRAGNYLWYPGHGLPVTLPNNDRLRTAGWVQCSVTNFFLLSCSTYTAGDLHLSQW